MKPLFTLTFLLLFAGCATLKKSKVLSDNLNGTWIPVKQQMEGKELPAWLFANQKLEISDSVYVLSAESVDKGVLQYKNGKMDIFGREGVNAGKHFTAIYKLENGQLTICYNMSGKNYPNDFETKSENVLFMSVFEMKK